MSEQTTQTIHCNRCDLPLAPRKTSFEYLGRKYAHEVPCCPKCGKVFIPEALAAGKMAEVEKMLEDK
ncbi:MAG: hypothetical protein LBD12_05375 [Clostridiales Family XIII bacterium]|nr:hypothetical protein [Clostridiales Family XIII bacterium]